MGRYKNWKPGDVGYLASCELAGVKFVKPVRVQVVSVDRIGMHPIKVRDDNADTYYCTAKELKQRAAKAAKDPAKFIVTEAIKEQAEASATERMDTIMEAIKKEKPLFDEVAASFYEIERARQAGLEAIAQLAENALYLQIKDGVAR